MIGYMGVEEQVDADFSRARRKNALRRAMARLRNGPASAGPPCFEEFKKQLGAVGGIRLGPAVVRSTDIVGSVGRSSDFDRTFLPAKASLGTRWKRIDRAFHRGEELPPVSLYKVGGSYFVLDGNHRVSVYRYHGVEWVDADVTEFGTRSDAPSPSDPARPRIVERTKEHTMLPYRSFGPSAETGDGWTSRDDRGRVDETSPSVAESPRVRRHPD